MTGQEGALPTAPREPMAAVVARWRHLARRRIREREFWTVQALVIAVTVIHVVVEATDLQHRVSVGGLVELPVVLHIIPVVYAGFRYGYEGSVLTGLWSAVLAIPNIVFWHSEGYGWLGDQVFIGMVIVLGVVIAVPVERERRQRQRAEAASHRLQTLNRLTAELSAMTDPETGMTRALAHLVDDLPVRSAHLLVTDPLRVDEGPRTLGAVAATPADGPAGRPGSASELARDPMRTVVPLDERPHDGMLVVEHADASGLDRGDRELLANAARQIGSSLEASRLRSQEQDRLRAYAREVTRAQERERSRIARDLHDVVAQELTLLSRRLDDLDDRRGTTSPRQVRELANDILDTVRHVSRGLRPPALDDLGLVPALRALADDLATRTDVPTDLEVAGEPRRLPHEVELTLYRIAQESLHNAERHAAPSRLTVAVTFGPDQVEMVVGDDGPGFDPDTVTVATTAEGGLGLLGMQERAALAGGSLDIVSRADAGTTVTVRLPV